MDAFDTDVLIYASIAGHPLGRRVRALFPSNPLESTDPRVGVGSVLLLPELLTKPLRLSRAAELEDISALIGYLELRPTDRATAQLATTFGATYRMPTLDAVHLATAVHAGADRFITNNCSDFPKTIAEIDITYPLDLPDPGPVPAGSQPAP